MPRRSNGAFLLLPHIERNKFPMQRFRSILPVIVLQFIFGYGCDSDSPRTEYFAGQLTLSGDTIRLHDCATGDSYPVARNEIRSEIAIRFRKTDPDPQQEVSITCKGRFKKRPDMPDSLWIDRLLTFDPGKSCDPNRLLVGTYEYEKDGVREILYLKSDRSFRLNVFSDENEKTFTGRWSQSAELELELTPATATRLRFEIIPNRGILEGNGRDGGTAFRKIHF